MKMMQLRVSVYTLLIIFPEQLLTLNYHNQCHIYSLNKFIIYTKKLKLRVLFEHQYRFICNYFSYANI